MCQILTGTVTLSFSEASKNEFDDLKSFLTGTHLFLCLMKLQNLYYQALFLKNRLDTHPSVTGTEGTPTWLLGKEGRFSSHPTSSSFQLFPASLHQMFTLVCGLFVLIIIILNKFLHLPDLSGKRNLTPTHHLHTLLHIPFLHF